MAGIVYGDAAANMENTCDSTAVEVATTSCNSMPIKSRNPADDEYQEAIRHQQDQFGSGDDDYDDDIITMSDVNRYLLSQQQSQRSQQSVLAEFKTGMPKLFSVVCTWTY